jgi:hypothetical protein
MAACCVSEAFAPAEARRILRRLQLHYTPKHASWLNMVEIEIGVLRCRCLDRRINDPKRALKWAAPIPIRPKSHNHCAELLGTPRPNRSIGAEEFIVHPIAG